MLPIKRLFNLIILVLLITSLFGCASIGRKLKNLVGGGSPEPARAAGAQQASFNSQPAVMTGKERKYKRVTKDNFSDEQALEENAGSLWRKEGQGSYLFTQNNLRVLGDIINVDIEGKTSENLAAKLKLIKTAWAKFDAPPQRAPRKIASTPGRPSPDKNQNAQAQAPPPPEKDPSDDDSKGDKSAGDKKDDKFDDVPCRIVEKNGDGSYRVKGQQTIFVGRREYKLIVTGIVRPGDVETDKVSSVKVLDGKFDVIASTKEVRSETPR